MAYKDYNTETNLINEIHTNINKINQLLGKIIVNHKEMLEFDPHLVEEIIKLQENCIDYNCIFMKFNFFKIISSDINNNSKIV